MLRTGQNYGVRELGDCKAISYPPKNIHLESVGSSDRWTTTPSFVVPIVPNPMQRSTLTWLTLPREARRRFLKLCLAPQGENVFFVVTNLIVTPNQRQGICAEV